MGAPPPEAPISSANVTASAGGGEASSYYDQSQSYRATQATTTESRDVQPQQQDGTWYGRVTGMFQNVRTPSPQNFFDGAAKGVSAGMAALGSILEDKDEVEDDLAGRREDDDARRRGSRSKKGEGRLKVEEREKEGFSDHERWSEEAEEQQEQRVGVVEAESERRAGSARAVREEKGKRGSKKAVAVVVSAATDAEVAIEDDGDDDGGFRTDMHAVSAPPRILRSLPCNTS